MLIDILLESLNIQFTLFQLLRLVINHILLLSNFLFLETDIFFLTIDFLHQNVNLSKLPKHIPYSKSWINLLIYIFDC